VLARVFQRRLFARLVREPVTSRVLLSDPELFQLLGVVAADLSEERREAIARVTDRLAQDATLDLRLARNDPFGFYWTAMWNFPKPYQLMLRHTAFGTHRRPYDDLLPAYAHAHLQGDLDDIRAHAFLIAERIDAVIDATIRGVPVGEFLTTHHGDDNSDCGLAQTMLRKGAIMSLAWEVTTEDVYQVLRAHEIHEPDGSPLNPDGLLLRNAMGRVRAADVEEAILRYTDFDDQVSAALDEIEDHLIEAGVIPAAKAFRAP
jgi:hypothetical protein